MTHDETHGVGALFGAWADNIRASVDKLVSDLKRDMRDLQRQGTSFGDLISSRLTPVVSAARATPRAGRIAGEIAMLVAAYRLHGLLPESDREALDRRWAERIYQLCVDLRGAVLKLGQFASTRRDLLPPAYVEALGRLQDSVPPVPFEPIAARIAAELGAPVGTLFASFDPEPVAAASLAQVHRALLPDGTHVAVKVQVPGVEEQVESDLSFFSLTAAALRDVVTTVDVEAIAEELGRSVREELDYRREARSAELMANDLAGDRSVLVPRVHESLSSARVLTMDWIEGERLTDFLDRAGSADTVLAALIRTYARQILGSGRFQADPHPGNFLVCPDGRLALLDFGAVHELTPDQRRAYVDLTRAMIARDRTRAADLMAHLGFTVAEGGDPAVLVQFADLLLDAFRPDPDRPLADIDPRAAFDQALALGRRSPIRIPHHFVQIGRVLTAIAGLVLAYRPRIQLWPLLAPHLSASPDAP